MSSTATKRQDALSVLPHSLPAPQLLDGGDAQEGRPGSLDDCNKANLQVAAPRHLVIEFHRTSVKIILFLHG